MKSMLTPFGPFVTAACLAATLSGCGGGGGGNTRMDSDTMLEDLLSGIDLGEWAEVRFEDDGDLSGIENTMHGLKVILDDNEMFMITATSPAQPTITGTWEGRWLAGYGEDFAESDAGEQNTMSIDVTIQGNTVEATLTYQDVDFVGGGSITTPVAAIDANGRFRPSGTVTIDGAPSTYFGEGQFGGTDQQGVVGYISSSEFASIFWGDRDN